MASAMDYWLMLRQMSRATSVRFGVDLRYADQNTRAMMAIVGAQSAMLLKMLVDKGVVTDADIAAAWESARNEPWAEEPVQVDPFPDVSPADPS